MRSLLMPLLLSILFAALAYSEEEAVSTSGRIVLLKDDGTWVNIERNLPAGKSDFRSVSWGMSPDDVIRAEGISAKDIGVQNEQQLAVTNMVSGYTCFTYYFFAYKKLVRTVYLFQISHSNSTDYVVDDYPKIKDMLSAKYGPAISDIKNWKNDLYKDDPTHWGTAVGMGYLQLYSQWKTERTSITEFLSGDNFNMKFGVQYSSIDLEGLEKQQTNELAGNDF